MESPASNIFIDSCQYTPVYFVQDPSISQARSYVVKQDISTVQKPVSDNLKKFYESSGKLENNLCLSENTTKPRILKKTENNVVGNNLKLASILLPKSELAKPAIPQINNVILKPVYIANTPNINTVQKLDINNKIVKLKEMPNIKRTVTSGKVLPKTNSTEIATNSKHTSVQLLKLGETYHSLNHLSDKQMKIVNHALKIFKNPEAAPQPTYDPITNTKYIYKVVSPKDLTVVGKKNIILPDKNLELKKIEKKIVKKESPERETESDVKIPIFLENAVTRSGRKVKISKNILREEIPNKCKRKVTTAPVSCQNCSSNFSSVYRLQRHYEIEPSHAPDKVHLNLFQCLSAIIKSNSTVSTATVFLEQLEQFINKLRSCIPCLLKIDESTNTQSNIVSEDVGRLLGIHPGNYNLNMDALNCDKDLSGHCQHNPAPKVEETQLWVDKPNTDVPQQMDIDGTNLNLAKNKPITKRAEIRKLKPEQTPCAKKLKVNMSEDTTSITTEEIVALLSDPVKTESLPDLSTSNIESCQENNEINQSDKVKEPYKVHHKQFHSTHFDIRSSPIKSTTNTFSKFQINTENMPKYKVHIIQPLQNQLHNIATENNSKNVSTDQLFDESVLERKKGVEQLSYDPAKIWPNEQTNNLIPSNTIINEETSNAIKPSLIHIDDILQSASEEVVKKNEIVIQDHLLTNDEHSIDALNFLESLGNECIYPETELRNNTVDFQLDLFSFNST